jgi:putative tryptophan/tyrosine transport system substrate-binding protein
MRRREFIAGFGAAAALSRAGRAQQSASWVVGYLDPADREIRREDFAAVVKGLKEEGFIEGRNLELDARFAEYDFSEMPKMASDLVRRRVAVIFARTPQAAHAAKAATAAIPIVFMMGEDPVAEGLVTSLSRPGGNVTGFTDLANQLGGKRLELLHEAVPKAASVALLVNPNNPNAEPDTADMRAAAATGRLDLHIFRVSHEAEFEHAFATMARGGVGALAVNTDPYFGERRALLVELAARYSLPTLYPNRVYSVSGGLISYSPDRVDKNRQAGIYVGRILKGEKPSDLPVQQSTKFDLVINMKTARALNLSIPETLLATADQVIE